MKRPLLLGLLAFPSLSCLSCLPCLLGLVALALPVAACSGVASPDVILPGDSSEASPTPDPTASAPDSASTTPVPEAGSTPDVTVEAASPVVDATVRTGTVDATTATPDVVVTTTPDAGRPDVGSPPDSGVVDADAGGSATFACGMNRCSLATQQACCVQVGFGGVTTTCANAMVCPGGGATFRCTSSADCGGTSVCCLVQTGAGATADCRPNCAGGNRIVCASPATPGDCPGNLQCSTLVGGGTPRLPPNVGLCQ